MPRAIDKVTRRDWQRKLMTSQLSIDLYTLPVALCFASVFRLAKWRQLIVTSGFRLLLSTQTLVKTTANAARLHDGGALYYPCSREDYYRKTPSNIARENRVKCFEVFCTIFQTRKSFEVNFAYKS